VQHIVTEDLGSELQRFRAGELDITEQVPAAQVAAMAPALRDQLRIADYLGVYYYGFNLSQPPFDNRDLRRALNLAVDRDVIVYKVLGSGERAAYGWLPPRIGGATSLQPEWAGWSREQRLTEARRLYAQAGYSAQRPLQTEILYNTHDYHQKIAVVIAAMWKQFLGVQTRLHNEETQVFLQSRRDRRRTQIFRGSWVSDYDDASSFLDLLAGNNPRNDTGYVSARYDNLLASAASQAGDARAAQLFEAQRQLLADAPVIPIYFYVTKHLISKRVSGWQDNPLDHHYTRDLALMPNEP
jgi:ABC-type oligopeptide transport system substrate-binding subunit